MDGGMTQDRANAIAQRLVSIMRAEIENDDAEQLGRVNPTNWRPGILSDEPRGRPTHHVSWGYDSADDVMPINRYREQYLRPAAIALAGIAARSGRSRFALLTVPVGTAFGAIATAGRYSLRVVKDYDIDADKDIVRVDIGLV
jgi:hypothetical protein